MRERFTFGRSSRLHGRRAFAQVYAGRCRQHAGPLMIYGLPRGQGPGRLGLSVSRRLGNAVRRNRIKRLIRETFRLGQHDHPLSVAPEGGPGAGYDWVVVVRPHEPAALGDYQRWLRAGMQSVDRQWRKRSARQS